MESDCLEYRALPGQNPLFSRFLYKPESVREWYGEGTVDPSWLKGCAQAIVEGGRPFPRADLAELLRPFNQRVGSGPATMRAIEDLGRPDSVAIVTGQQVGMFGGPALSVYKAVTALRLARFLRDEGFRAVPVFWLASDDSDFDEARSTSFIGDDCSLVRLSYPRASASNDRPVGSIRLARVSPLLEELESRMARGEFRSYVLDLIREAYRPDRTFSEAFAAWLALLFREEGLVLFDTLIPGVKTHVRSVFKTAILQRDRIMALLRERNRSLERAGFSPQVQTTEDETLLFRLEGGKRVKLEFRQGTYQAKPRNSPRTAPADLVREAEERPETFAPNVLLRPIVQDHLFPTVAYVGGPAEIAYFAQITAIAPEFELDLRVLPRSGATIVDPKAGRLLERHRLREIDVIGADLAKTRARLVAATPAQEVLKGLDKLESEIRSQAEDLERHIQSLDPTVADLLSGAEKKILYQASRVRNRFILNYARHTADIERQSLFLHNSLYPNGQLQERVINFNQFLIHQGPAVVERVLELLQPFCKGHHVLRLHSR